METLDEAVCLGMVRRGGGDRDAQARQQLAPRPGGELGTSVGSDSDGDSKPRDSVIQKRLEHRVGGGVRDGGCLGPPRGAVDHGEEVPVSAVRGEGADEVDVDVRETRGGNRDGLNGRGLVPGNLAGRAGLALAGPPEDVTAHSVPGVGLGEDG